MTADLDLTVAEFGKVVTAMTFAFGLGALPAGLLSDRVRPHAVLVLFFAGAAISLAAASFARTAVSATIGLVGLGAAASLYHPTGLALISREVRASVRGTAIGYHGIAGTVGEAAAPYLIAVLADLLFGWRGAFRALAAISAVLAVATLRAMWSDAGAGAGAGAESSTSTSTKTEERGAPMARVLILYAGLFFVGFCYRGALTYLPELLRVRGDGTMTRSGLLTSLALSAGLLSQWLGGRLADRVRMEPLAAAFWACIAVSLHLLGSAGGLGAFAAAFSFAFFYYAQQPATNALVARYTPAAKRGLAYGLSFATSFGLGAVSAQAAGAVIGRSDGRVWAAYPFLAIFALGATAIFALLAVLARRDGRA
jgi:predicted MFS family arabinose efflux permease